MKSLKPLFVALAAVFAVGSAHAYYPHNGFQASCSLGVPGYVPIGQNFNFTVQLDVQSWGNPYYQWDEFNVTPPFFGTFYGTKNGVNDIPNGYVHPAEINVGANTLTGYGNPGGFTGHYTRYLVVTDTFGNYVCSTNVVSTYLQ